MSLFAGVRYIFPRHAGEGGITETVVRKQLKSNVSDRIQITEGGYEGKGGG